jgi:hypothetical protein
MLAEHAYYTVKDATERDALLVLLASQLTPGLTCYVISEGKYYELSASQKWVVTTGPAQTACPVYSPLALTITSAGGAVATEVVRLASAGVLAKAQADTAAHAAAVIGVYDGTSVVPIHEQPIAKFDSAPVVGRPCYLSATVAGALTSTLPGLGAIAVPANLSVLEDKSVGAAYAARVGISGSEIPALNKELDLVRIASSKTGVLPAALNVTFDDFTRLYTGSIANWGGGGGGIAGGPPSALRQSNGTLTQYSVLPDATISAQKWFWSFRFRQYTITTGFKIALVKFIDATHGYEVNGVAMANLTGWKFTALHPTAEGESFNPWTQSAGAGQYDILQAEDILWHTMSYWCSGDGIIYYSWDEGTPVAMAQGASGQAGLPLIQYYGGNTDLDYVFFAYGS